MKDHLTLVIITIRYTSSHYMFLLDFFVFAVVVPFLLNHSLPIWYHFQKHKMNKTDVNYKTAYQILLSTASAIFRESHGDLGHDRRYFMKSYPLLGHGHSIFSYVDYPGRWGIHEFVMRPFRITLQEMMAM